jgi:hypothetical protein
MVRQRAMRRQPAQDIQREAMSWCERRDDGFAFSRENDSALLVEM